jgi:hypothetical protein
MAVTTVRDDARIHGGHSACGQGAGGQGAQGAGGGNGGQQVADGGDGRGNSGEHGNHGGQPVPSFWNENKHSQNGGHHQFKLMWYHA